MNGKSTIKIQLNIFFHPQNYKSNKKWLKENILKIAIDSPAAAGAGTVAKAISKHYNLFYLDTGKIYRFVAFLK